MSGRLARLRYAFGALAVIGSAILGAQIAIVQAANVALETPALLVPAAAAWCAGLIGGVVVFVWDAFRARRARAGALTAVEENP